MTEIPQELDWVEQRAACSAEQIFKELQMGIENDVSSMNAVDPDNEHFVAQLTSDGKVLIVANDGPWSKGRVKLFAVAGKIEVRDEIAQTEWSAKVVFSDDGRCRLRLVEDGRELEQWQFRKKALEGLFFGDRP
jgi:hypothetical protein